MVGLLWVLVVLLAIIWVVGFLLVHIASPLIHLLLLVALILIIWNLVSSPRQSI
jgi:hypothetical protein